MLSRAEFLTTIEKFLTKYKMSASTFGMKAKAEPNLVFDLREGRQCREEIQQKVLAFMKEYEFNNEVTNENNS